MSGRRLMGHDWRSEGHAKNVVKRGARLFLAQVIEKAAKINVEAMSLLPYAI
jgi:hypothetical protein